LESFELDELSDYYQGNTIFVGDSAHPLVPFTSQGVASALEDAQMLVNLLVKRSTNIEDALKEYSDNRKREIKVHIQNGKILSDNFLLPLDEQKTMFYLFHLKNMSFTTTDIDFVTLKKELIMVVGLPYQMVLFHLQLLILIFLSRQKLSKEFVNM